MPEFALRLQISIDDKTTADIFRIFDTVRSLAICYQISNDNFLFKFCLSQNMCGTIDFREYLLCALYLIKQNLPTIDLIHVASKMYDDCGKGPRNLSRKALYNVLSHAMAASVEDTIEIFTQIDTSQKGYITIGRRVCGERSGVFPLIFMANLFIGELRSFLQSKPEYGHLFKKPPQHKIAAKPKPKAQWICQREREVDWGLKSIMNGLNCWSNLKDGGSTLSIPNFSLLFIYLYYLELLT